MVLAAAVLARSAARAHAAGAIAASRCISCGEPGAGRQRWRRCARGRAEGVRTGRRERRRGYARDQQAQDERTRLQADRALFDSELASLEARAAPVWGGGDFASAKRLGARAAGAYSAGNLAHSRQWLNEATRRLARVEQAAPAALAAQLAAGDRALADGRTQAATQAYDLARRIDPRDQRAAAGLAQLHSRAELGPLLTAARAAQRSGDYPQAVSNYSRVLALDPENQTARAGLAESNAALTDEEYATAAGEGFAALGAGHLAAARAAFERAQALRPDGAAAIEGLRRVDAESHLRVAAGPSP